MLKPLTEHQAAWLLDRRIDPDTAVRYGVGSSSRGDIAFAFIEHGRVVNHKYRSADKQFRQDKDAVKCFWNHDAILDPALKTGAQRLIITEGEMDALSAIECGFPHAVSVPDGAPEALRDLPEREADDKKFSYVYRAIEALKGVKSIVLATDGDEPGRVLAQELVRRLGAGRCLFITYPEGCKDLNEVLMKHGPAEVARVLNAAKPWPVSGLYTIDDIPDLGPIKTFSTGWSGLDSFIKLYLGSFIVVTGIPNHGKSAIVAALCTRVAEAHGWHICMASFENRIRPFLEAQIRHFLGVDKEAALKFMRQRFSFICQQTTSDAEDMSLEWLLERARDSVLRYGTKVVVIDPWNEVEHKREGNESETEYISRAIRMMKRFATNYDCIVIVVAHPTKMNIGKEGAIKEPTLYDISGSSNWNNKADQGIVVHRPNLSSNVSVVSVRKVRFQPETGKPGSQAFQLNTITKRFDEMPSDEELFA